MVSLPLLKGSLDSPLVELVSDSTEDSVTRSESTASISRLSEQRLANLEAIKRAYKRKKWKKRGKVALKVTLGLPTTLVGSILYLPFPIARGTKRCAKMLGRIINEKLFNEHFSDEIFEKRSHELVKMHDEMKLLNTEIEHLKSDIDKSLRKIEELKTSYAQYDEYEKLTEEIECLESQIVEKEEELESLKNDREKMKGIDVRFNSEEIQELSKKIRSLKSKLKETTERHTDLSSSKEIKKINFLHKKIEKMERNIENKQKEYTKLNFSFEKKLQVRSKWTTLEKWVTYQGVRRNLLQAKLLSIAQNCTESSSNLDKPVNKSSENMRKKNKFPIHVQIEMMRESKSDLIIT